MFNISALNLYNNKTFLETQILKVYKCDHGETQFFTQVACLQKETYLTSKRRIAAACACIGVFGCFIFWTLMMYLPAMLDCRAFKTELNTVMAKDYTLELQIT